MRTAPSRTAALGSAPIIDLSLEHNTSPMSASHARRTPDPARAVAPTADDLKSLISKLNPNISETQIQVFGEAMAAVGAELLKLSVDRQRRFSKRRSPRDFMTKIAETSERPVKPVDRILLQPRGPVEVGQGEGLGEPLSPCPLGSVLSCERQFVKLTLFNKINRLPGRP